MLRCMYELIKDTDDGIFADHATNELSFSHAKKTSVYSTSELLLELKGFFATKDTNCLVLY